MLHRHVVAFLDEAIVSVDITARANDRLCASWSIDACGAFRAEPLFACAEDHSILKVLVTLRVHSLRPFRLVLGILVEARAWYLKLQTLPIEHLVIIEAR